MDIPNWIMDIHTSNWIMDIHNYRVYALLAFHGKPKAHKPYDYGYPWLIVDIHNWNMDIHNWNMDIHNWNMDIHNWIMDIHNRIMDIHNNKVYALSMESQKRIDPIIMDIHN